MAEQVVWEACTVTHPKTGEDTLVKRDEYLPDWVDEFTKSVLLMTGATRHVEDTAAPDLEEEPLTPVIGKSSEAELIRPSVGDDKATWVAFATDVRNPNRISDEVAKDMTKNDLMKAFPA